MTTRAGVSRGAVDVADWLRRHASTVLSEWQRLVQQRAVQARELEQPLLPYVPEIIDWVADLIRDDVRPTREPQHAAAERRALIRLGEAFDPAQVVLEFSLLRECLLRTGPTELDDRALLSLNRAIDRSVAASVARYAQFRERALRGHRAAEEVHRFLSECSKQLAESIEYEATLASVTRLAVPRIADWCAVDLLDDGHVRRVSVAHVDPARVTLAEDIGRRYPPSLEAPRGIGMVLRTGRPDWIPDISDVVLKQVTRDAEHFQTLRHLGLRSLIIVPMIARGRVLGALTMASAESGRRYTPHDVSMAEELARRAAVALDNARLHREAREAVRIRENVLAVVSHDLRNPLSSIVMAAGLLARRGPQQGGDDRGQKQVESIQRAANRMERLINELLDMARIQAGRLSIEPQQTDLVEILADAIDPMEPLAQAEGLRLHRELPEGPVPVLCDRQRVIQALSNLLSNAIKYGQSGRAVTLRATPRDHDVVVAVEDSGQGIPRDELPRVFDPYWTADRNGAKGTGLGLFITKGIVEAHGGRIWAESEIGRGSTFLFTLPRA